MEAERPAPSVCPSQACRGWCSWLHNPVCMRGSPQTLPQHPQRGLPLLFVLKAAAAGWGWRDQGCPSAGRGHSGPSSGPCSRPGRGQQHTEGTHFKKALVLRAMPVLLPPHLLKFCALAIWPALPCNSSQGPEQPLWCHPGCWALPELPYLASALSATAVHSPLAFLPGKKIMQLGDGSRPSGSRALASPAHSAAMGRRAFLPPHSLAAQLPGTWTLTP